MDGRYQLPEATVVYLTFGNPALPPEYQYGYDVTFDASGHAVVTISPIESGTASSGGTPVAVTTKQTAEVGEGGLRAPLGELCKIEFFTLPLVDTDKLLTGGEDEIDVTLADGQWQVNAWRLMTSGLGLRTRTRRSCERSRSKSRPIWDGNSSEVDRLPRR